MKLQYTDSITNKQGIKLLVYGESGVGKTQLCSTAPDPIIISAESGLMTLRKFKLPFIEIKTVQDLNDAYEWCMSSKESSKYKTICIDSISEIAEVLLVSEKAKTKDPRKAYGEVQDLSLIHI